MAVHDYLKHCLEKLHVLPQAAEILRRLLPESAARGLIPRPIEDPIPLCAVKRDLSDYSKALSEKGRQIDRGNRPEIETEALIPQQWRLPGYSVFLLAVYRVFGEPLERWAGIVGAVIGAFTPL